MHLTRPPEPTLDCGPCVLRAWRRDDLDSLVRHADNPKVARGLRDRFPNPYTHADGEKFLAGLLAYKHEWRFAIDVGGVAVGGLGFHPGEDVHRHSAEVGYWLGESFWGQGIVAAALRAVVPLAMVQLRLVRVHAGVYANNQTSMRALEKAGFEREGVQRCAALKDGTLLDIVVYARVRQSLEEPVT